MLALLGRHWAWLAPLLLIVTGCAAYLNSFSVPLLLDDVIAIRDNPSIHRLWPLGPVLQPPGKVPTAGRPLLNLSFALNYAVSGTAVGSYHAVNLAIHLLAGLTLFGLVRQTLRRSAVPEKFRAQALPLALLSALLWLLHPLQTYSVTYLSQRAESLMGLFYLATLYCFVRGAATARPAAWFGLSILCCFLGMATKETMVTAPVLVLLYDRTFVSGAFWPALRRHRWLYTGLAASWLLLAGLMLSSPLQDRAVGAGVEGGYTWWSYALVECPIVLRYLKLAVWPSPLVFDYGVDWPSPGPLAAFLYPAAIGLLVVGTFVALRRRPFVGFLLAWFFLLLAPTSSVIPISGQPMAENRVYLSLAAVAVAVTAGAWAAGRGRGLVALLLIGALLGAATFRRNVDCQSEVSIWTDTTVKQPQSARGHHNLGVALGLRGEWAAAVAQYEEALRLRPVYPEAHQDLATALSKLPGRMPDAMAHYEQALAQRPDYAETHNNLGAALVPIPGRADDALAHLQRALALGLDRAEVHFNLGLLYLNATTPGHLTSAIEHYEKGLALDPAHADAPDAHLKLGNALFSVPGRLPDAIRHYEAALRLRPGNALAENNLAGALLSFPDRLPEALQHYRSALQLQPDYAEAHYNLALALLRTPGHESEAAQHLETALRLRPDLTQARDALRGMNR